MKGAKITLNFPDELHLVIGTGDLLIPLPTKGALIFYLDYQYSVSEKLILGTPDTLLTTFP